MHRDAGPPRCKLIQIQKFQKARGQPNRQTDRHIILPLRLFYPVAFSHMLCTQLWAAWIISNKRYRQPNRETDNCSERRTEIWNRLDPNVGISCTGPHWVPLDPSVGVNASQLWTPTLEINSNTKTEKGPRKTGRTDILYFHSGALNPWPAAACAARNYGLRLYCHQKLIQTNGHIDIETDL